MVASGTEDTSDEADVLDDCTADGESSEVVVDEEVTDTQRV